MSCSRGAHPALSSDPTYPSCPGMILEDLGIRQRPGFVSTCYQGGTQEANRARDGGAGTPQTTQAVTLCSDPSVGESKCASTRERS